MFKASTIEDSPRIQEWTAADPYHNSVNLPEWWLTGQGVLSFCLTDDVGPVVYVRVDSGDPDYRISCQFAPIEIVSKRRLVRAMIPALAKVLAFIKERGGTGVVFNSTAPELIKFMVRIGFLPVGKDDYRLAI